MKLEYSRISFYFIVKLKIKNITEKKLLFMFTEMFARVEMVLLIMAFQMNVILHAMVIYLKYVVEQIPIAFMQQNSFFQPQLRRQQVL
jgi:hypothetical protein